MVALGVVHRRGRHSSVLWEISRLGLLALSVAAAGCYTGPDGPLSLTSDSEPGLGDDDDDDDASASSDPSDPSGTSSGDGSTSDGVSATEASTVEPTTDTTDATSDPTNDPTVDTTDTTDTTDPTNATTETTDTTGDPSTTSTTGTTDMSTTSTTGDPDVPDVPFCGPAADWPAMYDAVEEEMLPLVNQHRAQGANCGSEGSFGAAPPLTMHPALRCAARMHSKDMADNDFFSHTNLQNEGPGDRIDKTGYNYSTWGENIAAGNATAAATVAQWMDSDGHCANIMNPNFEHIGIGYYPGGQWGHLWTQVFGAGG